MAAREMRASWRRLLFFFICIAVGVGAIVAIRSVIQSVRHVFAGEARALITRRRDHHQQRGRSATKLAATIDERLKAAGAESIRAVELATMARAADTPGGRARMVELRAVEAGFPYYGVMKLANGAALSITRLLRGFGVLVRPELLAQLDVAVGDALTIGSQRFTIRGVIESEPGRRLGAFSIGPRVFVDLRRSCRRPACWRFGSRAIDPAAAAACPTATLDGLIVQLRAGLCQRRSRACARTRPPRTTSAKTSRARRTTSASSASSS